MRAVVVDRGRDGFRVGEVPEPVARPDEVLVRVTAFSVNFGEVRDALDNAPDGAVPGWEAAGVVAAPAADGTGPPEGTPVVSFDLGGRGWAEYRVAPAHYVAPIGADADPGPASTVVIAGASALRALRRLGPILGERVLVTGATGGVGRYAIQLAGLAGARPVALTRQPDRDADVLRALSAREVYGDVDDVPAPLAGVVDSVGGPLLAVAFDKLGDHGTLVTVGQSSGADAVLPAARLIGRTGGHDRSIATFFLPSTTPDLGPDLTWLAARVHDGTLDPGVSWRGSWDEITVATRALLDRTLNGKAVVDVG